MDLTLDYNIELYPLKDGESFAMALATSLLKGQSAAGAGGATGDEEDKDRHIWRPDGKGVRGLEEEYDYVMYGKVRRIVYSLQDSCISCANDRSTSLIQECQRLCACIMSLLCLLF